MIIWNVVNTESILVYFSVRTRISEIFLSGDAMQGNVFGHILVNDEDHEVGFMGRS